MGVKKRNKLCRSQNPNKTFIPRDIPTYKINFQIYKILWIDLKVQEATGIITEVMVQFL